MLGYIEFPARLRSVVLPAVAANLHRADVLCLDFDVAFDFDCFSALLCPAPHLKTFDVIMVSKTRSSDALPVDLFASQAPNLRFVRLINVQLYAEQLPPAFSAITTLRYIFAQPQSFPTALFAHCKQLQTLRIHGESCSFVYDSDSESSVEPRELKSVDLSMFAGNFDVMRHLPCPGIPDIFSTLADQQSAEFLLAHLRGRLDVHVYPAFERLYVQYKSRDTGMKRAFACTVEQAELGFNVRSTLLTMNGHLGVPTLPVELLSLVYDNLSLQELLGASHVSKFWRTVALRHRTFWRDVTLSSLSTAALDFFHARLDAGSSRSVTIRMILPKVEFPARLRSVALPAVTANLHRIDVLRLKIDVAFDFDCFSALRYSAARLKRLDVIMVSETRASDALPVDLFASQAPNLRVVRLVNAQLYADRLPPAFSAIATLRYLFARPQSFPTAVFAHCKHVTMTEEARRCDAQRAEGEGSEGCIVGG
ncbi:hypothetical protein AURDEDRAFT_155214 [Auricularia subglabra TFB-10046 SS5]|nr:hypothetical protein AURDEDRAFT_155214 [Auricularia subglabra TFB-10046 SS5]